MIETKSTSDAFSLEFKWPHDERDLPTSTDPGTASVVFVMPEESRVHIDSIDRPRLTPCDARHLALSIIAAAYEARRNFGNAFPQATWVPSLASGPQWPFVVQQANSVCAPDEIPWVSVHPRNGRVVIETWDEPRVTINDAFRLAMFILVAVDEAEQHNIKAGRHPGDPGDTAHGWRDTA